MPRRSRERQAREGTASSSAAALLSEARKLKQQAERKPVGVIREQLLTRSAEAFESALKQQLTHEDHDEALFDLAETLYMCGNSIRSFASKNSLTPLSGSVTRAAALESKTHACIRSAGLYRKSCETYAKITLNELKEETIVNSGNTLCDWAEVLLEIPESQGGGLQAAAKLYSDAYHRYTSALEQSRDDLDILTNLADCCVKRAELFLRSQVKDAGQSAASLYDQALEAYNYACSVADSRKGDDLCGLLQNWAAGFASKAQHVLNYGEAVKLLDCAREKLRTATTLSPADATLYNALGELSMTESEKLDDQLSDSEKVYSCMLAATQWFGTALRINSENMDALVSIAEAHHLASKSMRLRGVQLKFHEHAVQSTSFYLKAVELLKADLECQYDLDFCQQCDLLFNLACAAAHCGREADAAMALKQLVQVEAVTVADLLNDPDLESFKSKDWFHSLLNSCSPVG